MMRVYIHILHRVSCMHPFIYQPDMIIIIVTTVKESSKHPLQQHLPKIPLNGRPVHSPDAIPRRRTQPKPMVTRTLLVALNTVPISPINNTSPTRPLPRRLNPDVLRRRRTRHPPLVVRRQRVPHANRIMQAQLGVVAHVTLV